MKNITISGLKYARSILPPSQIIHLRADYKDSISHPISRINNPSRELPCDPKACSYGEEKEGEIVIVKSTIDGFHLTSLEKYLQVFISSYLYVYMHMYMYMYTYTDNYGFICI